VNLRGVKRNQVEWYVALANKCTSGSSSGRSTKTARDAYAACYAFEANKNPFSFPSGFRSSHGHAFNQIDWWWVGGLRGKSGKRGSTTGSGSTTLGCQWRLSAFEWLFRFFALFVLLHIFIVSCECIRITLLIRCQVTMTLTLANAALICNSVHLSPSAFASKKYYINFGMVF